MSEPDLDDVQRVARATCAQLHTQARTSGHLVRDYRDPGNYHGRQVWPIVYAALATGLLEVKP